MLSTRYTDLTGRISDLRTELFPKTPPPGRDYRKSQRLRAGAYFLYVHVEIENFIEEWAKEIVTTAKNEWTKNGTVGLVLTELIVHYSKIQKLTEPSSDPTDDSTTATVKNCCDRYFEELKKNNGISDRDLYRILLPLGFTVSDFDDTFLADVAEFSKKRGALAHHRHSVSTVLDPILEDGRVSRILSGLEKIDETFVKIRAAI